MKRKNKFLEDRPEKKHFDAFNVISALLFVAGIATFTVCLINTILDMINASDKVSYIFPLIARSLALIATFLPLFLKKVCKINVSFTVSTIFYTFLFVCVFIGSFSGILGKINIWVYVMNIISGFLFAVFALIILNHYFYEQDKTISPFFMAVFCIGVSATLMVCWESFEFVCDLLWDLNFQNYNNLVGKDVLMDTMSDLLAGIGGAVLSGIMSAIIYSKNKNYLKAFSVKKVYNNKEELILEENDQQEEIIE